MNYKKLIASVVFALGTWMSVGVAQAGGPPQITNYDFTATLSTGDVITANLTADTANSFALPYSPFTNVDPLNVSNFKVNGVVASITNSYFPGAPIPDAYGWVTSGFPPSNAAIDLIYSTGANQFTRIIAGQPNLFTNSGYGYFNTYTSEYNALHNINQGYYPPGDLSSVSFAPELPGSGGVAPEMNASFIPQVGLLLGCLFFLVGRKKEVVEPMLTA